MIIAFTGRMGSGKSTAIEALKSCTDIRLVKFAQPLYDMQELIYNRISSVHSRPSTFIKDRKLLQWLGTDWGRGTISDTIWVDLWKAKVLEGSSKGEATVCDDVRFDNEAETIRSLKGVVIEILSSKITERINTQSGIKQHSSEAGTNPLLVDYTLINDGTKEEFEAKVKELYKTLIAGEQLKAES